MLVTAQGTPLVTELRLTDEDARTLRAWKKILLKYGYRERLWCKACAASDDPERADRPGCKAYVTDYHIAIHCRHLSRTFSGGT